MKKSFHIFQRDLSRLLHNKAAILVLIGVCLLPSLYAWFNIAANLDPYGNTSKIKVAIACLDKEASSENLSINAGKEIVKNLKENKQLGWTFTSEKEALNGVKSGKYYASIVIPEDFSRSLISILSGDLQTPKLDYYINEKANAIAPKITGTGAAAIQEQINSTFSSVASESVSGILKQSASDLSSTLGSVNSDITKTLEKADANIAAYKQLLENFNAAGAKFTVTGFNIHPGGAKDTMINAIAVASEIQSLLPEAESPRNTEGYEGFYHLTSMSGDVAHAESEYIIRDHDAEKFAAKEENLRRIEKAMNEKYGEGTVKLEIKEQYRNMAEKIRPCYHLIENAEEAARRAGMEPIVLPIRGGTDGARLSYMGLPCPNLFAGGHNFHSNYEYVPVPSMEKAVSMIVRIAELAATTLDFQKNV